MTTEKVHSTKLQEEGEVFYVTTKDKTVFAIYDLTFEEKKDILELEFGFAPVETTTVDKSLYADEIGDIMHSTVSSVLEEYISDRTNDTK